ncbi:DUF7210 family protein [Nitrosomonas communis]|uniref:DUF7210 domain-containing protein n=1 Tax=Nitrosomonas communis TaxID=44574 RepID=A0A1I4NC32_9PROT|nr:hypothetical protein [Nitrosomonas communis]SFM13074.1 hypothetical protein SAMN05421863_101437 [Nitrosomonas communis]
MYRIKLLKTHTHEGQVHFAGHVLEVDEMTASWLIKHNVGKVADEIASSPSEEQASSSVEAPAKTKPNRKIKE